MNLYKCQDIFPKSGRRPVRGLETFAASDPAVHTSALFTPCSDGLIKGYERAFNFCNQLVTSCVFILFSLKSNSLTCARARGSNNKRNVYAGSRVRELI